MFPEVRKLIENGDRSIPVQVNGEQIVTVLDVSDRQRQQLLAGGALNLVREELKQKESA